MGSMTPIAVREIPARAVDRWYVGVDLGQSTDPTAITVLNHRVVPLDTWKENIKAGYWKQDHTEHFDVKHLERLPLATSYPRQIEMSPLCSSVRRSIW